MPSNKVVFTKNSMLESSFSSKLAQSLKDRKPVLPQSSWERETGRGYSYKFGQYKLSIKSYYSESSGNEEKEEQDLVVVVIDEDCSMIATRVWDCAALTAKWFEHQIYQNGNLANALGLLSQTTTTTSDGSSDNRPIQILELGAGLGLLSICLAKMGAAVVSSEYGVAVKYLTGSCDKNHVLAKRNEPLAPGKVKCCEIDWFKTEDTLESLFLPSESIKKFDLIVVTDCTLSEKDAYGIMKMFHKYGTPGHTKVVAGACVQREGTPYFIQGIQQDFHNVQLIPTSQHHPKYKTSRHTLVKFDI